MPLIPFFKETYQLPNKYAYRIFIHGHIFLTLLALNGVGGFIEWFTGEIPLEELVEGIITLGVENLFYIGFACVLERVRISTAQLEVWKNSLVFLFTFALSMFTYTMINHLSESIEYVFIEFVSLYLNNFIPYSLSMIVVFYLYHLKNNEDADSVSSSHVFKHSDGQSKIRFSDILFCKSGGNYLTITYLEEGNEKQVLCRMTLKEFEELQRKDVFIRTHRSYIVNATHMQSIIKVNSKYFVCLQGEQIPISQSYLDRVQDALQLKL